MNFLSVCSGIEAASVAWKPLGWKAAGFSEIEPFPCAVLKHHYPDVPNYGDMTKFKEWPNDGTVDLVCGGTPCQSFSVAGLRKGLEDPRGNLMLVFLGVVDKYRPRYVFWENVHGVLSSNGGRDFGAFLGGLGQLGFGWAYRCLDAQYHGLAQRRKRVFVVGCSGGEWQRAATILFDRASLQGNPAPSRETRERIAPCIGARTKGGGGLGTDAELDGALIPTIVGTLSDGAHNGGDLTAKTHTLEESLPSVAWEIQERDAKGPDSSTKEGHLIPITNGGGFGEEPTCFSPGNIARRAGASPTLGASTLGDQFPHVAHNMAVRRLTPVECARLQGFPDSYLDIIYRGKPACDGVKYKALGNSWAVPCARWIGQRIQQVEDACKKS